MKIEHNSRDAAYRSPMGALPCRTLVKLRAAVESESIPDSVECYVNDKTVRMYYVSGFGNRRIYQCVLNLPSKGGLVWYCFRAEADGSVLWYGNNPEFLGGVGETYTDKPDKLFQITVYEKDYKTPDWMKNAVVYQIFPDRFFRGDETEFHGIPRAWGETPFYRADQFGGEYTSDDFFGGNLSGIKAKLPYLKELGVTAVYLNPIFKSPSNHRYNTGDYETVDPLLGTNKDFAELAKLFKKNGIRLILDGVFSHTGDDSRYFNKYGNYDSLGAYQSKDSPYYDWYSFKNWPEDYESWWGFKSLPNTNEMTDGYLDYIVNGDNSIVRRWIKNGASGWRLDVADELPDDFIKQIRTAVKKADPDAVLIGEVWEDASHKVSYGRQREYFWGKSLDAVMNYVSRGAILDYLLSGNAPQFLHRLSSLYENYPKEALYACLNLISTHDVPRALTVLSGATSVEKLSRDEQAAYVIPPDALDLALKRMRLAVAVQMTIPGAPCVYYGDEVGVNGYADPFNRTCYPWGAENKTLFDFHKELIALRTAHRCLRTGSFLAVFSYDEAAIYLRGITGGKDVFGDEAENETMLVALNPSSHPITVKFSLERYGVRSVRNALTGEPVPYDGKNFELYLAPLDFTIFELDCSSDNIFTL